MEREREIWREKFGNGRLARLQHRIQESKQQNKLITVVRRYPRDISNFKTFTDLFVDLFSSTFKLAAVYYYYQSRRCSIIAAVQFNG